MIEHCYAIAQKVDNELTDAPIAAIYSRLRDIGLADFGELLWSMPDAALPNLTRALPRMASLEVQMGWTGNSGTALLMQTCNFVRSVVCNFTLLTGRSLENADTLDFGCGYGRIARLMYFYTHPDRLIGVDPWDRSIGECRDAGLGDNFRQSDYLPERLPVGDQRFDLIYAFSIFTHLSERATRCALQTLRRYVRDDGVLVITIRPVEFWSLGQVDLGDLTGVAAEHRSRGFAFVPLNHVIVDGDLTYGNTSFSLEWLAAQFPYWRVMTIDRSLDDPYQIYVFLQPAAAP